MSETYYRSERQHGSFAPHDPASGERGRHEGERDVQERRRHHRDPKVPEAKGTEIPIKIT